MSLEPVIQSLKPALRRAPLAADAARSLRDSASRLRGLAVRRRLIERHRRANPLLKVMIGAAHNVRPGWLSTDRRPWADEVVYLDAARRFPFDDSSVDYLHAEHMIEHIPLAAGRAMLAEAYRCLRPGGRIRVATPDLRRLLRVVLEPAEPETSDYIAWSNGTFGDTVERQDLHNGVITLNRMMRDWGHTFLYDRDTLTRVLLQTGFEPPTFWAVGESDDANLRGIESHGDHIGQQFNRFETMVAEAVKPLRPASATID